MNLKNFFLFFIIITTTICLTGCKKNPQNIEKSEVLESKKDIENIRVGVLKIVDSLPIYIGKNAGIFKDNGVNVEIVEFSSASEQSKAMESGAIDAMMTDMIVQSLIQKGGTEMRTVTTALGATVKEGKFLVLGNKDSKIKDVKDLEGKSVAISKGTMMEYLVDSYCKELGVNINKVQKVNIPSLSLRLETLMEGGVDAAILPDPLGDVAVNNGCITIIDDTKLKNNVSRSVIAFNNNIIKKNPNRIKNFIKGYNLAIDRVNEHNESDINLIHDVAKVPEELWGSWTTPNFTKNSVPGKKEVEDLIDWMINNNLIEDKYEYLEVINPEFCKEAE